MADPRVVTVSRMLHTIVMQGRNKLQDWATKTKTRGSIPPPGQPQPTLTQGATPPPGPSVVAGSPAVFWVRLFQVPPTDPTVPSTATAFKVTPLSADVDGLKDAVKLKVPEELAGVSVLRLQVWGHDAGSNRWVHVDEDTVLKTNSKATAYHVVVIPKA